MDYSYSPDDVSFWLRNWEMLESLAENPRASVHLLSPECKHSDHACSDGRPVGIKSTRAARSDPHTYSDLKSDLEQAVLALPPHSLESQVVAKRISSGRPMIEIRAMLGCDYNRLWAAYRSACKLMALSLGWEEDPVDAD